MTRRLVRTSCIALPLALLGMGAAGCANSEMHGWAQTAPGLEPQRTTSMSDVVLMSARCTDGEPATDAPAE